jgi:DNA mismatch repair protein MutS
MCGVPVHAAESYLARLIRAGHRVAIAEQTESPAEARKARGSKALVDRAIVRLVTPGTLTEETLARIRAANWLAAVGRAGDEWAIAAADISTGRFELVEPAARASWPPSWRGCRRPRRSPTEPVPGIATTPARAGSTAWPASAR